MTRSLANLEKALGWEFRTPELLREALTHASVGRKEEGRRSANERLEFLGDAVLGLVVAAHLMERAGSHEEGALSRMRAALVCEESLFRKAQALKLESYLEVGQCAQGLTDKGLPAAMMADAVEAIVGAVFLDGGYDAAAQAVQRLFAEDFEQELSQLLRGDVKSNLQEICQQRFGKPPLYELTGTEGPDHARNFYVSVRIANSIEAHGVGTSKKRASQDAAAKALEILNSTAFAPIVPTELREGT